MEEEISKLEEDINSDLLNIELEKIQKLTKVKERLVDMRKEKIDGVTLRSRCRYQDLGENRQNIFLI